MNKNIKRIILSVLIVALVLSFTFAVCGCDFKDKISGLINSGDDGGSDDSGSGSGSNDSETEATRSQQEIENLLGNKYIATISVAGNSSTDQGGHALLTFATNGTYSIAEQGNEVTMVKKVGGRMFMLSREYGGTRFTEMIAMEEEFDPVRLAMGYLVLSEGSLSYTSRTSISFLNRACTKYVNNSADTNIVAGYSSHEEWIIDNATGACFKHEWTISAYAGGEAGQAASSFEVTRFETGNSVDQYIGGFTDEIAVSEWDDQYFSSVGLGNVPAPSGRFVSAQLLYPDSSSPEYETQYLFEGDQAEARRAVLASINAFYAAGANLNDDNVPCNSYDDPTLLEEEDGYISFRAGINNEGAYVEISGYFNGSSWQMEYCARGAVAEEDY